MDFLLEFSFVVSELGRLVGMRFAPGDHSTRTVLGAHINRILEWEGEGDHSKRDWEFACMKLLVKNLQEIGQAKPELLRVFKRAIRRAGNTDSFFGARFEVNIAASLIRKNVNFEKTEIKQRSFCKSLAAVEAGQWDSMLR